MLPHRTRNKLGEKESRTVWKPAFSTPLGTKWPEIPSAVAESLLEMLLKLLDGRKTPHVSSSDSQIGQSDFLSISQYKTELRSLKKRKMIKDRKPNSSHDEKRSEVIGKTAMPTTTPSMDLEKMQFEEGKTHLDDIPQPPPLLNHILLGINTVTKEIEGEISEKNHIISQGQTTNPPMAEEDSTCQNKSGSSNSAITALATHKLDDSVPLHSTNGTGNHVSKDEEIQPMLETASNSKLATLNQHRFPQDPVLLVPLLKGAEKQIATALGIKRAAVLGLGGKSTHISELHQFARMHIKPILSPTLPVSHDKPKNTLLNRPEHKQLKLIPTHVKYYKATTPVDMRKHHLERSQLKRQRKAFKKCKKDSDINDAQLGHKKKKRKKKAGHTGPVC